MRFCAACTPLQSVATRERSPLILGEAHALACGVGGLRKGAALNTIQIAELLVKN